MDRKLKESLNNWLKSEKTRGKAPFPLKFLRWVSQNLNKFEKEISATELKKQIGKITGSRSPSTILSDLSNPHYYGVWFKRTYTDDGRIRACFLSSEAKKLISKEL